MKTVTTVDTIRDQIKAERAVMANLRRDLKIQVGVLKGLRSEFKSAVEGQREARKAKGQKRLAMAAEKRSERVAKLEQRLAALRAKEVAPKTLKRKAKKASKVRVASKAEVAQLNAAA